MSGNEIYATAHDLLQGTKSRGSILDFGSGQGRFLRQLQALKFGTIYGSDLMNRPDDLPLEIKWLQADLNEPLPVEEKLFDVVIAIEVIEHLENPRKTVREWYRLLKPGGKLILSTPNNGSIRSLLALLLKGHFVSFLDRDYPAHITALTRLDLQRILKEANFVDTEFHFIKKGLIPGLRGLSWQKLSLGLLQGERFSDNIFVVASRP